MIKGYTNPTVIYEDDRGAGDWVLVCTEVEQDGSFKEVELHFFSFNQLYEAETKMLKTPFPVPVDNILEIINNET